METLVLTLDDADRAAEAVREAADRLARGELVVFPTETVYGLGASAADAAALDALHDLKQRPPEKPFTLHLPDPELAERYAGELPRTARRIIRRAWPGPLTLVLPDRRPGGAGPEGLLERGVYWNGTVGLRCPNHRAAREILREAGVPVVASSANQAGRAPPRSAGEALAELDGRVPLVIDAGPTPYARPSTVARFGEDGSFEVLRAGAVTDRRLRRLARTGVLLVCTGNVCRSPMAEALARRRLADRLGCDAERVEAEGFDVASAGTSAADGLGPSDHAIAVMHERGIDIRDHRSRPVTVDGLLAADYIYVMTRGHRESVSRMVPEAADRVALLDPEGRDVVDPLGGDLDTYRRCLRHIEQALADRIEEVME